MEAVKLLHADIRETGEDSHVDTGLIVNKLTLTMDSAKDLKDVMPPAPLVQSLSSTATAPTEEEPTPSEVVASELPLYFRKI